MASNRDFSQLPDATTPAIYAAQLVNLVTGRWGISREKLLEDTGLVDADLADVDSRLDGVAMGRLMMRAVALTKEPGLGFYFGLHVKLSAHGSVGFAAMTSATLRDALEAGTKYYGLRSGHSSMSYRVVGDSVEIEIHEVVPLGPVREFVMDALMTELSQMARNLTGQQVHGRFEVRHREPRYFQGFAHLLPGPVRFERPKDLLILPARWLDTPLVFADELASAKAVERCEHELATLDEASSLLASIRRQMRARSSGFPSLTELADRRHVSTRTIKRQLAAHGTSFQRILDELRRDRAIAMLASGDVSVDRVAEQLGYADPSNFNRAFKRWMGMSPSAFREEEFVRTGRSTAR